MSVLCSPRLTQPILRVLMIDEKADLLTKLHGHLCAHGKEPPHAISNNTLLIL